MFESITGWDPHEVSPFRTGKSLVTFKRGAGTEARALGVKQLSGWQGHVRAGVDHLFKKFAHERRGGTNKEAPGDMFPGLCDCSLGFRGQYLQYARGLYVYIGPFKPIPL